MSQCPICQTKYTDGEVHGCSVCGWDLTPYPLTFAGQLPEVFLEKERAKLGWAREMWARGQSQQEQLTQSHSQREQLQRDLDMVSQEKSKLQHDLDSVGGEKSYFQEQVLQLQSEFPRLNEERVQLRSELSQIQTRISQNNEEQQLHFQKQLSQTKGQLKLANQEHLRLQSQLEEANRRICQLTSLIETEQSKWQLPERKSERGVDFRQLEWLLILKSWEEADRETWTLLLKISGSSAITKGFLDREDIENMSINDLKVINEMWTVYSSGQYGFSSQWKILKNKRKAMSFEKPSDIGYYPAGYILRAIGINGLGLILTKLERHNVFIGS